MKNLAKFAAILIFWVFTALSCTSPRVLTNSGKVTPKGNIVAGYNVSGNIPTQTISSIKKVLRESVDELINQDTIYFNPDIDHINEAALAYSLDPLMPGSEFYIRYGIINRLDAGFKFAGAAKAFDFQYQFLGPLGNIENENNEKLYGSIGFQIANQKQELPSILGEIQGRLGYSFKKTDFLIPVTFSYSFGNEEKYGGIAFGLAINYSKIQFGLMPADLYTNEKIKIFGVENKQGYFSFGSFINCKIGYKYVFIVPAISIFRQNYGKFELLSGYSTRLKGWTFIPSIGIKIRIGKSKAKI